jgi:hypothetical protein
MDILRRPLTRFTSCSTTKVSWWRRTWLECLLDIDKTHFAADRRALIISYALTSFDQYFADADARDQGRILAFAHQQFECGSPKTRKLAKDFVKTWEQPT